jgi:hypothetical protein
MRTALALILATGLAACSATEDEALIETPPVDETPAQSEEADVDAEAEEPSGLPGTDIHVFALSWEGGLPVLGARIGGIARPGYDNQPFFSGDGGLLYTAGDSETGETDIWHYDLTGDVSRRVTNTPDASEYSPRVPPGEAELSYIYQPPGGYAGHAFLAAADNTDPEAAHALGPVGYYVFSGDMRYVATFALGETNTLQLIDRSTTPETVTHLADNPGRTLLRAPGFYGRDMVYTVADESGEHTVHYLTFEAPDNHPLFKLPGSAQDFAIFPDPIAHTVDPDPTMPGAADFALAGFMAVADDQLVYRTAMSDTDWSPIGDLSTLSGITRLTVSPDLSMIAIVAEEAP